MKKITRMLAALAAVATMTVSACALPVNAEETCWGYSNGEISDAEYQDYVSNLNISNNENKLIEMYREWLESEFAEAKLIHVYYGMHDMFFELAYPNNNRIVQMGFFMGLTAETPITASADDMNRFLSENALKGKVGVSTECMQVSLSFEPNDSNRTYDDTIRTYLELSEKFNLKPELVLYNEKIIISNLLGDANGDGTLNIRDCAMISRSLINGTADDLPDTADYNKDGIKNIRDGAAIAKVIAQNKN